jgi:RNA polymerase sigma-70 factor (ECF subfamily)
MPVIRVQTTYAGAGAREPDTREAVRDTADRITAAELHARYLTEVFRYILRRVPRREEAEDITAQVFAAAFAALPRFRGQCAPHLWLLGIARRQIAAALRRRAARRESLASELAEGIWETESLWAGVDRVEGPETAVMRAEARQVLHELVAALNTDQQEALLLQYVERLSVAEIAVVMGRSPAAVYSLLKRARAAIYKRGQGYFLE